jgi:hypothetical protein
MDAPLVLSSLPSDLPDLPVIEPYSFLIFLSFL